MNIHAIEYILYVYLRVWHTYPYIQLYIYMHMYTYMYNKRLRETDTRALYMDTKFFPCLERKRQI